MSISTQLYQTDANSVTFAAPLDPNYTVRFKTTRNRKSLRGTNVDNYVTEIIVNDLHDVNIGDQTAADPISVRLKVSGAEHSMDHIQLVVNTLADQLAAWGNENVFLGFRPTTLPTYPTAE